MTNQIDVRKDLFTMQQIADELRVSKATISNRINAIGLKPEVEAKVGGRNQSPALYNLETFRRLEEEELKRQEMEDRRITKQALAIPDTVQSKAFGLKLMALVESADPAATQELEATTALLLAAMHKQTELANARALAKEEEIQMLKDEHEIWMTWLRFIQRYPQFRGYRTWRMKDLKRDGIFLKDFCKSRHDVKEIQVVGSKYETQLEFHIEDLVEFFDL
jgi:hypothetical protein